MRVRAATIAVLEQASVAPATGFRSRAKAEGREYALLIVMGTYVAIALAVFPAHFAAFLWSNVMALASGALVPALLLAAYSLFRGSGRERSAAASGTGSAVLLFGAYAAFLTAYTTYKFNIPSIVPFHADGLLAEIDRSIHGTDPWRIAHGLAGDWWRHVVVQAYSHVWFAAWFGTVLYAIVLAGPVDRARYLWGNVLTLAVVGTILATLLSSAGPNFPSIFADGARFVPLRAALEASPANASVLGYIDYLRDAYFRPAGAIGTGISAMPSVHVAIAVLNALFYSGLGRWRGLAAWLFAALILFGSVYTGWHYAADGYVSIAVVSLIWWVVCRWIVARRPAKV